MWTPRWDQVGPTAPGLASICLRLSLVPASENSYSAFELGPSSCRPVSNLRPLSAPLIVLFRPRGRPS